MNLRIWHFLKLLFAAFFIAAGYVSVPAILYWKGVETPFLISLIGSWVGIVTGLIALLRDSILGAINKPILGIEFHHNDRRDCHRTEFKDPPSGRVVSLTYYFRLRIKNFGWNTAESVEVNLEQVERWQGKGFVVDHDFMPMRLTWSNWRENRPEFDIPFGTYRHCDLGFILEPGKSARAVQAQEGGVQIFWFDVLHRPNAGRSGLRPGRYRLTIRAVGKNTRQKEHRLSFEWKGGWYQTIEEMVSNGFVFY